MVVAVPEAEQQVGQDVDDVRLKQPPQHQTQHLKRKQRTWGNSIITISKFSIHYTIINPKQCIYYLILVMFTRVSTFSTMLTLFLPF